MMRLTNSAEHPLSEQEIVDATVAFANGARLEIEGLEAAGDDPFDDHIGDKKLAFLLRLNKGLSASDPVDLDEAHARLRVATCTRLSNIMADPAAAAREYVGKGLEAMISAKTILRATPSGLLRASYYTFSMEFDLLTLGEVLLAADDGFRQKLCQCQLASCGAFFFEKRPPTGRPQRRYCTRAHMLQAHDENASGRMARKRPRAKPK